MQGQLNLQASHAIGLRSAHTKLSVRHPLLHTSRPTASAGSPRRALLHRLLLGRRGHGGKKSECEWRGRNRSKRRRGSMPRFSVSRKRDIGMARGIWLGRVTPVWTYGFSGVAPGSALHCSIELVEVLQLKYLLFRQAFILQDLLFVCLEQFSHVVAHGFAVHF